MISQWISFDEIANPKKKTKRWAVRTPKGENIGAIYWYSPWRKYIFHPLPRTLWEEDCLNCIVKFIEHETLKHHMGIRAKKETKELAKKGMHFCAGCGFAHIDKYANCVWLKEI